MIFRFSFIEKILLSKDIIPHPFGDASFSVGLGFALGTAVKLKIADSLRMEFQDAASIASGAGCSVTGTTLILDCLDALGYVVKKENKYAFNKRGFDSLSPHSPQNFRHFILFCDYLYKGYLHLDETIRSGKRSAVMLDEMSHYEWELFSRAMIDIAQTNVKEAISKIPVAASAASLLDLGGSHGLYSIEICKKHPSLRAQVMDFPQVKPYFDECAEKHKAGNHLQFCPGNFMKDELPAGNDIILAFNVIHGLNDAENGQLAEKVFRALNPGGIYVILDQIKGIGGSSQLSKATTAYMALNLLHQAGGRTYTELEVKEFAAKAGFTKTRLKKLHAPGFGVIICQK